MVAPRTFEIELWEASLTPKHPWVPWVRRASEIIKELSCFFVISGTKWLLVTLFFAKWKLDVHFII